MGLHEEKVELLRKYYGKIETTSGFFIKGDIPSKRMDNAVKKFASGLERETVLGFYDTTLTGNGKAGYLFTDTKVYYLETLDKTKKIWYDDIKSVELFDTHKKDCDRGLRFHMYDGSTISWTACFLNKTPLYDFLTELLKMGRGGERAKEEGAAHSAGKHEGAAAMKSAAKLLRGNTITAGVTVIVLSSFDVANIC